MVVLNTFCCWPTPCTVSVFVVIKLNTRDFIADTIISVKRGVMSFSKQNVLSENMHDFTVTT